MGERHVTQYARNRILGGGERGPEWGKLNMPEKLSSLLEVVTFPRQQEGGNSISLARSVHMGREEEPQATPRARRQMRKMLLLPGTLKWATGLYLSPWCLKFCVHRNHFWSYWKMHIIGAHYVQDRAQESAFEQALQVLLMISCRSHLGKCGYLWLFKKDKIKNVVISLFYKIPLMGLQGWPSRGELRQRSS